MPKRGQRQPYRVRFTYPPDERNQWKGITGVIVKGYIDDAARAAEEISRRGGTATVVRIAQDKTATEIGTFKPNQEESD
jgi:hypothetical protein